MLACFAVACKLVTRASGLERHAEELQRDASLCSSILDALVAELVRAGNAPQEAAASWLSWVTTASMAAAVASAAVKPALQRRLEAAAARGDSHGSNGLLHAAARLLVRMPLSCPAELTATQFQHLWSSVPYLLGRVCSLLGPATQQQMAEGPLQHVQLEQQQLRARSLLPALHTIAAGLRVHLAGDPEHFPPAVHTALYCRAWVAVLDLLWAVSAPVTHPDRLMEGEPALTYSQQDLADWCMAASAAVRALPLLAQAERLQRQAADSLVSELRSTAAALAVSIVETHTLASAVFAALQQYGTCSPSSASSQPLRLEALWQLHSAGCRVIHWAEGCPDQEPCCLKLAPLIDDPLLYLPRVPGHFAAQLLRSDRYVWQPGVWLVQPWCCAECQCTWEAAEARPRQQATGVSDSPTCCLSLSAGTWQQWLWHTSKLHRL